MDGNENRIERWMQLCAQAAAEQDPNKLLSLVKEINSLLEKKQADSKNQQKPPSAA